MLLILVFAGLLSAREYILQSLPRMPHRTSDRASSSMTQPRHARTFAALTPMEDFAERVNNFVDSLPDDTKKFNKLVIGGGACAGGFVCCWPASSGSCHVCASHVSLTLAAVGPYEWVCSLLLSVLHCSVKQHSCTWQSLALKSIHHTPPGLSGARNSGGARSHVVGCCR